MKKRFMMITLLMVSATAFAVTEDDQQLLDEVHAAQAAKALEAPPAPEVPPEFASEEESSVTDEDPAPTETVTIAPPPPPAPADVVPEEVILERPSLKGDNKHDEETEHARDPHAGTLSVGLRVSIGGGGADVSMATAPGFAVRSDSANEYEFIAEHRENNLGIEVALMPVDKRSHELTFFGSSLGTMTVVGPSWTITGKYYMFERPEVKPYIGIGFEQMQVKGFWGMGGTPFETKGDGWHIIGRLGAQFPFRERYAGVVEYKVANTDLVTEIPGGGGKVSIRTGSDITIGVVMKF